MPRVVFIDPSGHTVEVNGLVGDSVMQTAVDNDVDGIVGECGGGMMCATCHVYVDPAWADRLAQRNRGEAVMLEEAVAPTTDRSRLSCQIELSEDLDGLVIHTPNTQL